MTAEPTPGRRLPMWALALVAVLCVAATAAAIVCGSGWFLARADTDDIRGSRAQDLEIRRQYVDTASRVMTHIMTIRQDTIKQDVERITSEIEGDFQSQFTPRQESYEEVVTSTKVLADGTIAAAGVEKLFDDHADVVMAVDQKITNPTTKKPEPRNYRMRITVNRHADGVYKVSGVNFIP